jgi:hypothetical protein
MAIGINAFVNRRRYRLFGFCLCLAALGTSLAVWAAAHDIITTNLTYTRDISRIMTRRCLSCHGQASAIPLTSYEEVRPWAVDIKEQVLARAMPPWGAVKGFGDLKPDNALSQEEIMIISAWVIGGAPHGNKALASQAESQTATEIEPPGIEILTVATRAQVKKPTTLVGIRPASNASSARITAHLPDGRILPLVWLYQFDAKSKRTFFFRTPLALPSRTIIESSEPLQFTLEGPSTEISRVR